MEQKKKSDVIDISAQIQQYISKWYLFVISVVVCGVLALGVAMIKRPVYSVTANVLIDEGDSDPLSNMALGGIFSGSNYVDDEIFVISSHSLYVSVAKELGLDRIRYDKPMPLRSIPMYKDYPIDVITPAEFADTTKISLTFKVKVNDKGRAKIKVKGPHRATLANLSNVTLPAHIKTIYGDFTVITTPFYVPGESYKNNIVVRGYDVAAEGLNEKVSSMIANKKTHVIEISYPTPDVEFGKRLVNTIMAKYDERVIANRNQQSVKTVNFLDNRIAEIAKDLSGVESGLQNFKESNKMVDIKADTEYNLTVKGEMTKQLYAAETQLAIARMANDFINTPGNEYALIPFTAADESNAVVNATIASYNQIAMKRLHLLNNAKEDNVQVKAVEKQLDAMRANLLKSLASNVTTSEALVRDLRKKVGETENTLSGVPGHERTIMNMQREQYLKAHLYMYLMEKREATSVMLSNAVSKGVVVDPAFVSSQPISLSKFKIIAIGLLLGLIFPIIYLFARKAIGGRPESRAEAENHIDAPVLGEISTSRANRSLVVTSTSNSSTVELFKLVRTNLQFLLKSKESKVVMVTSSQSGEGKSFISINIASSFALLGKKVLLVGLDIRKPMLARYLDLPESHPGLTKYLSMPDTTFESLVQKVKEVPGLDVVTAGIIPPNPAELLLDPRLEQFFKTAREKYDYIIVDSAPVGIVSDSLSVADFADASVYVVRLGVTHFRDINFLNTLYQEKRLPHLSVVINGTKSVRGYGYGYGSVEDHGKFTPTKKGFFARLFRK